MLLPWILLYYLAEDAERKLAHKTHRTEFGTHKSSLDLQFHSTKKLQIGKLCNFTNLGKRTPKLMLLWGWKTVNQTTAGVWCGSGTCAEHKFALIFDRNDYWFALTQVKDGCIFSLVNLRHTPMQGLHCRRYMARSTRRPDGQGPLGKMGAGG